MSVAPSVAASDCSSDNIGTSIILDPDAPRPDESVEPSATVDEINRKSTVSPTTKLLRGVRDSPGAFGPLKSVARGLCFILENCKVCAPADSACDTYCRSSGWGRMKRP